MRGGPRASTRDCAVWPPVIPCMYFHGNVLPWKIEKVGDNYELERKALVRFDNSDITAHRVRDERGGVRKVAPPIKKPYVGPERGM